MTSVSFTSNLSDAIAFAGTVKIKCDDIPVGGFVELLEERVDGAYERPNENWAIMGYPVRSRLFELKGNYKIRRSVDTVGVGYEA
jgi:hypothetical protein